MNCIKSSFQVQVLREHSLKKSWYDEFVGWQPKEMHAQVCSVSPQQPTSNAYNLGASCHRNLDDIFIILFYYVFIFYGHPPFGDSYTPILNHFQFTCFNTFLWHKKMHCVVKTLKNTILLFIEVSVTYFYSLTLFFKNTYAQFTLCGNDISS